MLLRGPEYIGAKHPKLMAEQQHLSYHMTRAADTLKGWERCHPGADLTDTLTKTTFAPQSEMPVFSNRSDIGSSDALLRLLSADSAPQRRGKSQDDPYPPPRYDGLGVKLYIRLTVLQSPL